MPSSPTDSKTADPFQTTTMLKRLVLTPLRLLLDAIWHVLVFVVGGILVGGLLVNVIISFATTGTPGLSDPKTWVVSQVVLSRPTYALAMLALVIVIGLTSFLVHLRAHNVSDDQISESLMHEFGLARVQDATPTPHMIPFYRHNVYLPRRVKGSGLDADAQARKILSSAATRTTPTSQMGMCAVGRSLLGTSRFTWEALKHEHSLTGWVFVRWPENAQHYVELWDKLQQRHAKVVLWFDDLSKSRDDRSSTLINRLPYELEARKIPFIILATLPSEAAIAEARQRYSTIIDHVEQLELDDLTLSEARTLVAQLTQGGDNVTLDDRFDGTPGSIVLATTRMRDEIYPRLSPDAKSILRTIKLLRSAGIREYTLERVLRTSTQLFAPGHSDWTHEIEALRSAGFLRQMVIEDGRSVLLEPIAEIYLDVAVPDYSDPSTTLADWHRLLETLVTAKDGPALVRLADAFRSSGNDDRAEMGYRRALDNLTRGTAEQDWARAQFGLADIIGRQVDSAEGPERRKLLEQAEEAYSNVLLVVARDNDPIYWAAIQGRLAGVVRHEATTTVGRAKQVRMLVSAASNCLDALRILRRDTAPEEWADAQQNLGLIRLTHAPFVQDASTRRRMLDGAIEALNLSLTVFTPETSLYKWAKGRRYIGDASYQRAQAANRINKETLLGQAIDAYSDALRPVGARLIWSAAERADLSCALSTTCLDLGKLVGEERSNELLARAADSSNAAADAYVLLDRQDAVVKAYRLLSEIESERANRGEATARVAHIDAAIQANLQVQKLWGRTGAHDDKALVRLNLARLYWARATHGTHHPSTVQQKDVQEAVNYAGQALEYFSRDKSTEGYKAALKLQKEGLKRSAASVPAYATVPAAKRENAELMPKLPADGN